MRFVSVSACVVALLATMGAASPTDDFDLQYGGFVESTDRDIFVAQVEHVENANGTNANPPVVHLEVTAVLRGSIRTGPLRAKWDQFYGLRCNGNDDQHYREWLERPLTGPRISSQWVFLGYIGTSGEYVLNPRGRIEASPQLIRWFQDKIAATQP